MDRDIYRLTLLYLLTARELAITGQEHKAQVLFGLPAEAVAALQRVSLFRLIDLAARVSKQDSVFLALPQLWKDLAEDPDQVMAESLVVQRLVSYISQGDDHDHIATA